MISHGLSLNRTEIPLNYKSYDFPYIVRLLRPKLYTENNIFYCISIIVNGQIISGAGFNQSSAIETWTNNFRKHIETIPSKEVSEYIQQICHPVEQEFRIS